MKTNKEQDTELNTKQERFLKAYVSNSCNVSKACGAAKVARSTYYEWLNKSDTFRQKREEAEEGLYDHVEGALLKQINDGNITAIIFFAKTKMKDRGYVERSIVDNNMKYNHHDARIHQQYLDLEKKLQLRQAWGANHEWPVKAMIKRLGERKAPHIFRGLFGGLLGTLYTELTGEAYTVVAGTAKILDNINLVRRHE
jgi:hypothetical protein